MYLCDVTEAELRSSFLFLQFSVLQTSRQALSARELVCKKGRQAVPRSLSFPISHGTMVLPLLGTGPLERKRGPGN